MDFRRFNLPSILPLGIEPNHTITLEQGGLIKEPMFNESSGYVARMSGFVIAPYTGDFEFFVAASDNVALFISNTTSANDAKLAAYTDWPVDPADYGEKTMSMTLEGKSYIRFVC